MVQIKFLFRTGAAHIEQATFFFHLLVDFGHREHRSSTHKREDFVIATRQMDRIEFQALCHVNRHERHEALRRIDLLVAISQERNILQERIERCARMFFIKFADSVNHFVQVRNAFVGRDFVFLAQEVLIARIVDDMFSKNRERILARSHHVLPVRHKVGKHLKLRSAAPRAVRLGE